MKRWVWIVVVMIVLIAVGKNFVAKAVVSGGVKAITGLDLNIRSMDVGLLKTAVGIRGLTLSNPSGFVDPVMVDVPEIYIDYDPAAFLRQQVHLEEVRLDLKEFVVVKNAQGEVNLDALRVVKESKGGAAPQESRPAGKAPQLQIDLLRLKVGKVVYKDYTRGSTPSIQEFPLNLDERYEHITNPQALAALIVSRALMNTTVARLTGLDLGAIQSQLGAQLQQAMSGAMSAAKDLQAGAAQQLQATSLQASKAATGLAGSAKTAAEGAVKQTTETLKKVLPFGQ